MNYSIHRFSLDMHSVQSQISIPVLLGDTSRELRIVLSDGGNPYIIKDGCLAKITIKRPTGTHLEEFCSIEDNTTIVYPFDQNENTAAVVGIHDCDITLYDLEGKNIASPKFTMVVSERVLKKDDITLKDEDFTAVNAMVKAEAERQSAENVRGSAEAARISAEEERSANEASRQETLRKIREAMTNGGLSPTYYTAVLLLASEWKGTEDPYSQVVDIAEVTPNSKVDLLPSVEQLAIFHDKDIAFVTENEDGVVTVYAIGDKPTQDYTIEVCITEVVI